MSQTFQAKSGLIFVPVRIHGPTGRGLIRMALDTGATRSLINVAHLVAIGYDPSLEPDRVQVTTGSGIEFAPLVKLQKLTALGQECVDLPVLAHTLPPTAGIDGLLGLDFLRDRVLEIDFRRGQISLSDNH